MDCSSGVAVCEGKETKGLVDINFSALITAGSPATAQALLQRPGWDGNIPTISTEKSK